MESSDTMFR